MPRASTTKADTPTKAATKEIKAAKALKKQQKEDKPKVKRAPSPYIVFCTEKRPEAKEANPEATFGMLGKILGQMWGALDEAGKAVRTQATTGTFWMDRDILAYLLTVPSSRLNQPYAKVSAAKKTALESA